MSLNSLLRMRGRSSQVATIERTLQLVAHHVLVLSPISVERQLSDTLIRNLGTFMLLVAEAFRHEPTEETKAELQRAQAITLAEGFNSEVEVVAGQAPSRGPHVPDAWTDWIPSSDGTKYHATAIVTRSPWQITIYCQKKG